MGYSLLKTVEVPAQSSQSSMIHALASALAAALEVSVDVFGEAVIIDAENGMGFKFLASSTTNVGISIMNANTVESSTQAVSFSSPILIDYCVFDGTIAVGIRSSESTAGCSCIFARTQNGDPICVRLTNSSNNDKIYILGKNETDAKTINVSLNSGSNTFVTVQRLGAVYWDCLFDNLYCITSGSGSLTFNNVLEAKGKHYQVLKRGSSNGYAALAMRID